MQIGGEVSRPHHKNVAIMSTSQACAALSPACVISNRMLYRKALFSFVKSGDL